MLYSKIKLLKNERSQLKGEIDSFKTLKTYIITLENTILKYWDNIVKLIDSSEHKSTPKRVKVCNGRKQSSVLVSLLDLLFIMNNSDMVNANSVEYDSNEGLFKAIDAEVRAKGDKVVSCLKDYDPSRNDLSELNDFVELKSELDVYKQRSVLLESELVQVKEKCEGLSDNYERVVKRLNCFKSLKFLPKEELNQAEPKESKKEEAKVEVKEEGGEKREEELRELNEKNRSLSEELERMKQKLFKSELSEKMCEERLKIRKIEAQKRVEEVRLETKLERERVMELEHREIQLSDQLESFKSKLDSIKEKISLASDESVFKLNSLVKKKENDIKLIKQKHTKLKLKFDALQKDLKTEKEMVISYRKQSKQAKESVHKLKKQVGSLLKENRPESEVEKQNVELLEEVSVLSSSLEKESQLFRNSQKNVKSLNKEIFSLRSKQSERQKEKEGALELQKDKTHRLEKELERKVKSINSLEEMIKLVKTRSNNVSFLLAESQKKESKLRYDVQSSQQNTNKATNETVALQRLFETLQKETEELKKRNGELAGELTSFGFDKTRIVEENEKLRLKTTESKSDVNLRMKAMELALRCPVNPKRWKSAMLKRCSHSFAKSTLLETLNGRNRKCPTCKTPFAKDDIVSLYLYETTSE